MAFDSAPKTVASLFEIASARMSWASARQQVIAQNIANADTPEYRAKDVTSFEALLEGREPAVREAQSWETSLDGNRVVLEEQMLKANETESSYRMAAQLYRKGHALLALAVGK